ncbi:acyl-ACP--UDP-N-acetylglucosamine O-acyltransferase [Flavobacteriales bacterium]|jgi:UDP-N-acetylglucosamine acyltransferase|nr:acyl-ACP--UDP-N-acetylglucosamine O-acyltransferase [Flavobacteriales bacterium]
MHQPLAYIHPQSKIAKNVVIEPFVTIEKDVEIGEGTWIGPNVTIMEGTRIGKNCRVFPGAVIGAVPQDLKFNNEYSTAEIGDNVTIRECVTINRGTEDRNKTTIGNNVLLMAYVHVAHDCSIGNNAILANSTNLGGHVDIGEFAILGGGTLVHQFVSIGNHVMVSGGALVNKDIPPFVKAGRDPISYIGINSIGLRRRQFVPEKIQEIQELYRIIYLKSLNNTQAVNFIEAEVKASKERDEIISFIQDSKRGIMKGYFK